MKQATTNLWDCPECGGEVITNGEPELFWGDGVTVDMRCGKGHEWRTNFDAVNQVRIHDEPAGAVGVYVLESCREYRLDEVKKQVVVAASEAEARQEAAEHARDEGPDTWTNEANSTCELLTLTVGAPPRVLCQEEPGF